MALAPLGFTIDTSGVAKAVADLSHMTVETNKAEAATKSLSVNVNLAVNVINKITASTSQAAAANDNLTAATNRQAAAVSRLIAVERGSTSSHYSERAADIAAYGREMDRLRAKFDPLFAAQQRHTQAIEEINRANAVGAISATTAMQARIRETNAYQAQISVLHNLAAAQKASAQGMVDRVTITPDRGADIAAYGAELDRLKAKFNPLFAASKRYEQELNELNRAHKIGAISTAEHGMALTSLNARYQAAATGAQSFGASGAMAQQQMRNLAFQFQDIGTMLAAGQSPFMLLAQQLPQVTMYGGRLTGVMGALKSSLAGLFSPLGLLTTGFVLAGSAAISYFSEADAEADKAADAMADHMSAIERVADQWGDAAPALRKYADELRRTADLADFAGRTKEAIDAQFDAARLGISSVRDAVGAVIQDLVRAGDTSGAINKVRDAFYETDRAVQDLQTKIKDNKATSEDFDRVTRTLAAVLGIDVVRASNAASEALQKYRADLMLATDAASALADEQLRVAVQQSIPAAPSLSPLYSDGGQFIDANDLQTRRANATRSQYQIEQERLARQSRRPRKTDAERAAERYRDMIRQSQQFIASQRLERDALYMTEEAAAALRYEQELLNQAANDNIALTPEMAAEIRSYAVAMAEAEAETIRLQKALEFGKDLVRGFINDLRSGLEQGKSFWESFGNAALNVLDKLVDKLLNDVIDALFRVNSQATGMGGGGGFLSSIFGSLFGGGSTFNPTPGGFAQMLGIPGFASGTSYAPGGMAWVGERGPELVNLPRGSQVYSASQSRAMVANSNGMAANQNVHVTVGVSVDRDGNLQAYVKDVAQGEAANAVQENNRNLPEQLQYYGVQPNRRRA